MQKQESNYEFLQIGLILPQDILDVKINKRLKERFELGMIEEVERLHAQGITWHKLESFGLEYKYIALYLQKKIENFEELSNTLFTKIRQYSKRQMTWFKRDTRIEWFSPEQISEIETRVSKYLQN